MSAETSLTLRSSSAAETSLTLRSLSVESVLPFEKCAGRPPTPTTQVRIYMLRAGRPMLRAKQVKNAPPTQLAVDSVAGTKLVLADMSLLGRQMTQTRLQIELLQQYWAI